MDGDGEEEGEEDFFSFVVVFLRLILGFSDGLWVEEDDEEDRDLIKKEERLFFVGVNGENSLKRW